MPPLLGKAPEALEAIDPFADVCGGFDACPWLPGYA